jgi:hypothetical protein
VILESTSEKGNKVKADPVELRTMGEEPDLATILRVNGSNHDNLTASVSYKWTDSNIKSSKGEMEY